MKSPNILVVLLCIAAAIIAVALLHNRQVNTQRMESDNRAAVQSAKTNLGNIVRAGRQAAGQIATNVTGAATNVAARAMAAATNAANAAASAVTNAGQQARQKVDEITH